MAKRESFIQFNSIEEVERAAEALRAVEGLDVEIDINHQGIDLVHEGGLLQYTGPIYVDNPQIPELKGASLPWWDECI